MVLYNYAGPQRSHVAAVRRMISAREIRIDHANWLDDGSIYVNDPVVDVSAANDWSQIKVRHIKTSGWGTKIFPEHGFIGPTSGSLPGGNSGNDGDDEAASALMACNDEAPAPPPVHRVAVVTPPHAKAKPAARAAAPDPVVPATIILEDRNPPAESGFALTAEYRALP